jgi:tripartite-type tricarboxylate transporter receptor subunit TctC
MKTTRRDFVLNASALAAASASASAFPSLALAADEKWPTKPITYVVPFAPGGATDVIGRIYSVGVPQALGVTVVVDNRPGTGGSIGTAMVSHAKPDGYTIVGGTISSHAINNSIYPSTGYDPIKSFEPIILTGTLPNVLLVKKGSPFKSVADVIAAGKKPGSKLNFGSSGVGSSQHMTAELFKLMTGAQMEHIPYKGSGPSLQALMSGEIDLLFDNITSGIVFVNSGDLVPLAVTSKTASASLPNVKPLAEQGLPGFEVVSWQATFAPAGTPKAIIDKLYQAMYATLQKPDVREKFKALGTDISGDGPEKLRAFQKAEVAKWADVAKKANIRLE